MRPVTLAPSVPASGESLTRKVIASVGGSIGCAGSGVSTDGSQIVMATVAFGSAGERDDVAGFRLRRPARARGRGTPAPW